VVSPLTASQNSTTTIETSMGDNPPFSFVIVRWVQKDLSNDLTVGLQAFINYFYQYVQRELESNRIEENTC
jgi:hypothetical protein